MLHIRKYTAYISTSLMIPCLHNPFPQIPLSISFAKLLVMADMEPRCKILDRWNQVIEDPASPWKGCNVKVTPMVLQLIFRSINFLKLDAITCCYTNEKESNICSSSTNLVVLKSTFSDELQKSPGTSFLGMRLSRGISYPLKLKLSGWGSRLRINKRWC